MSRLEDFKSRMQEIKQYKSDTGKGYWDWKVLSLATGGEVKEEYDEFGVPVTTVATNAVKYALLNGNVELAKKIMSRPNRVENRYYNYPESGRIDTFLNTYDIPIIGDALSLVDAAKYALRRDWNNASTSFLDAASPLAMFTKSTKLNWKDWGAKSKYIPEYEQIEREARANGTWLKNEDGTDFIGDPREWVVKKSKKFKEAFGDNYLEGYTGMRNSYNPNITIDTYLGSKDRAYTYTPNKVELNRKNKSGVAKLVVPNSETYTVDAFGNDWLHLTDKNINPYNFTNTNLIVSNILTPVISFKNIRDDGPFGVRNVAEDLFVIKSTTPRKSVMYNNGDFDLSNPNIFKGILAPYIGYKTYDKFNNQDIKGYRLGGEDNINYSDDRTDHPILLRQNLDRVLSVADFTDRINHIDSNTGEYNPFYSAYDDTYGTVPLQEVTITAPWTQKGRNNSAARRGMHYVLQGLEDAAKVAAPIVAGAVLPSMSSMGLLGKAVDLASVATNPIDPLNYLPFIKFSKLKKLNSSISKLKYDTNVFKTSGDFTLANFNNDELVKYMYYNILMDPKGTLADKYAIHKPEVILITDDIKDIINNTVFPRLLRNRRNIKNLGKDFDYSDVYEYDDIVFDRAGYPGEGFSHRINNAIVRKRNSTMSRLKVFSHELRHRADYMYPYTDYELEVTSKAFDGFLNALPEDYDIGYDMTREIPTTILDARNIVLSKFDKLFYKLPIDILDEFIRKAPNNLIEKAIETSNSYGRRFINYLYDNDLMSNQRILDFRQSLIVGSLSSPIMINNNASYKYKDGREVDGISPIGQQ